MDENTTFNFPKSKSCARKSNSFNVIYTNNAAKVVARSKNVKYLENVLYCKFCFLHYVNYISFSQYF